MVVLMAVAACYGVLQLALLGSVTRAVRVSTLLLAVAGGCYGCGMLALVVQFGYTRVVHAVTGQPLAVVVETASYTVDPFVEEVVKLVPLVTILLLAPRLRRQWGYVDFLLVGASTGTGFALAEALLRFSGRAARAIGDGHGGFLVPVGLNVPHVRGLGALLTSWLPAPVDVIALLGDNQDVNFHLGWSALAALGAGFLVLTGGRRRPLGLLPLLWAGVDHAAANRSIADPGTGLVRLGLHGLDALRGAIPALVLVALVAATVLDVRAQRLVRLAHPELQLAGERSGTPSVVALARAALVAPPWTPAVVGRFVLARRAAWRELNNEPGSAGLQSSPLGAAVAVAAAQLGRSGPRATWPHWSWRVGPTTTSRRALWRNWRLLAWLVLVAPAVLYLVVGATPALSGLQTLMASRAVFPVLGALTAVGVAFAVWQLIATLRQLPGVVRRGANDLVLRAVSRAGAGAGAAVAGTGLVVGWLTGAHGGDRVATSFHILDALSLLSFAAGIALVLAAFIFFPPLGMVVLAEGGMVLVTTAVAGEFALAATTGVALGGLGTLLNEAADANRASPSTSPQGASATGSKATGRATGVNLDPVTRAKVQAKLPPEWGAGKATQKGVGTRWFGTNPSREGVRVDRGDPDAEQISQRVDHVIVRHGGRVIGQDGRPIKGTIAKEYESHIPLKTWLKWRTWWTP